MKRILVGYVKKKSKPLYKKWWIIILFIFISLVELSLDIAGSSGPLSSALTGAFRDIF
jgi:hypothetical protein